MYSPYWPQIFLMSNMRNMKVMVITIHEQYMKHFLDFPILAVSIPHEQYEEDKMYSSYRPRVFLWWRHIWSSWMNYEWVPNGFWIVPNEFWMSSEWIRMSSPDQSWDNVTPHPSAKKSNKKHRNNHKKQKQRTRRNNTIDAPCRK